MRHIMVACSTQKEADRGLRLAADLSIASGARLSLIVAAPRPEAISAHAGLEAIGHLSTVLFSRDAESGAPRFVPSGATWLSPLLARLHEGLESDQLATDVTSRHPDLVVACNADLARELVSHTTVPIWHLRREERSWFQRRTLRCTVRGLRAQLWAQRFAAVLDAELDAAPVRRFRSADLRVVDRGQRTGWQPLGPLVVV